MEFKIYENNEILRTALEKTISSFEKVSDNIIFINISYSEFPNNSTPYSGMKYIVNLRAEKKDTTPVIFYGFESLERLRKKPEASILNSPAIEYIKIPFLISELFKKIHKVTSCGEIEDGLDRQTKQKTALENIRIFKHDIINAARTVEIVYKLKREGSNDIQKENWNSVRKSLFTPKSKDQIKKNITLFENIKNNIIELLTENEIINAQKNLLDAEDIYKTLIKRFSEYSENNKIKAISDAEAIINILNEITTTLEVK